MTDKIRVETEIGLKVDPKSKEAADRVKKDVDRIAAAAKLSSEQTKSFLKDAFSTAVGTYLPQFISQLSAAAKQVWSIGAAMQDQRKHLTGMTAVFQDMPWGEAEASADKMRKQLVDMALELGVSSEKVMGGFAAIVRGLGAGTAEQFQFSADQLKNLIKISDALGLEIEETAVGFAKIAKGQFEMESKLGDVLRKTGLFGKETTEIAANWSKLTEPERLKVLTKAVEQQAQRLGQAQPTITNLTETIKTAGEELIGVIGKPVIEELIPIVKDLATRLEKARPEIEGFMRALRPQIAQWMESAGAAVKNAFAWIKQHGPAFKNDLLVAAKSLKDAFETGRNVVNAFKGLTKLFDVLYKVSNKLTGLAGLTDLLSQSSEKSKSLKDILYWKPEFAKQGTIGDINKKIGEWTRAGLEATGLYKGGEMSEQHKAVREQVSLAMSSLEGGDYSGARDLAAKARTMAEAARDPSHELMTEIAAFEDVLLQQWKTSSDEIAAQAEKAATDNNVEQLADAWNRASEMGNEQLRSQIAMSVESSARLKQALIDSGVYIKDGIEAMEKSVKDSAAEFKRNMSDMLDEVDPTGGDPTAGMTDAQKRRFRRLGKLTKKEAKEAAEKGGGNIIMNGGQKFEIKQDFRDQDPDRIAWVFRRDLIKAAIRRTQSNRGTILGGI